MIKKFFPVLLLFCFSIYTYGTGKDENDIVSVIKFGIKNDGSVIGTELNELVKKSFGKTLYFPSGTYNLSEAIVLPFDYTKNVNIIFDKNALIKTDSPLEALLKIGYSEMSTPDVTHRRFSYIEGGMFDCSNVNNGIMVNGLKQLVSLKAISLFKGRKTHIRIHVTDDFKGTGSCDTKIDNITIQGISSNEEVYGIYIDESCCDVKLSNTFIYSTKYGIVTKSAGHIMNNVHILSMYTTGGLNLEYGKNFHSTEGIRFESDGFFILNEIYFDTIDKSIVVASDKNPMLIIDKNLFYSYLKNFGTSFLYKDHGVTSTFQAKISNSEIVVAKEGYKIFDVNPKTVSYDVGENFTFVNCDIDFPQMLDPYDFSLMQRIRKKTSDALLTNPHTFEAKWYALGALAASHFRNLLRIDFSDDHTIELTIKFDEDNVSLLDSKIIGQTDAFPFQIGYVVQNNRCVLLFKPDAECTAFPVISDLLGNGSYMTTPSKEKCYTPEDYHITENPIIFVKN